MTGGPAPGDSIRVLLVDDHVLTREGLTAKLSAEPDIVVVDAVATVAEAVDDVTGLIPDVVVLDVHLPDGDGIALCRRIRTISPSTRCIVHTGVEIRPETAGNAGAAAVVLKQLSGNELLDTIRTVADTDR